ncbi:MAG: DUF2784 domain-containing protein [Nitrospiraceae bacterium]|nr:DUF2784 domain-containing protein [Nitrospiraceae bacterium]
MIYRILADLTVALHFGWILFLIFGCFLGIRYRWIRIIHIAALAFAVLINATGTVCPLTHLEIWLRQKHDPALSYAGSFIVHYIEKIIYFTLPESSLAALTIALAGLNIYVYLYKGRIKSKEKQ